MHTEKTYTVTELAKELGVSSAKVLNQIMELVLYSPYNTLNP